MGATRIWVAGLPGCRVAKTLAVWDAAEERCVRSTQGWLRPCVMGDGTGFTFGTRVGSDLEHKKW